MSSKNVLVVLLSLFVAANALATPHAVRHSAHHRALAARVAVPEPLDVPALPLQKRQNNRRCKQRPSSSAAHASTSPLVVQVPSSSVAPPPVTTKAAPTTTPTPKKESTTPPPVQVPSTSKAPPPAKTTKAPAPVTGNLPSFLVGTQTGQGTFYSTGLGACGITNKDTDHIAAVSHLLFDSFPRLDPDQGKSVVVTLTDRCTGCAITDLDFSPSAFNQLADFAVGRISGMTWVWND
ncbi:Allergen Asp f 7 [Psilocybe cubensis]|uniref:RlpA-like protein double-psi beta-barrel domain-containing protein n=2 Tax=Psilocybe cubensis TaxID=181762 RepID=A0A8H7YAX8_PSICU|nr:Allergen Asp f 7 [Psilocybe cubensis]KAH9486862.1 Allergen Asp f 7 [Psilocybe cubensis]